MLGHMIHDYLSNQESYDVIGLGKNSLNALDSEKNIERKLLNDSPEYIINCIGLINVYANKNKELARKINSVFPHFLAYLCIKHKWKLIHIGSDCYLDKDIYGKSKNLGEVNDNNNLTIRTSIIGPELKNGFGLFHWFMTQKGEVNGFTQAHWDGVTTLQLSKFIDRCISKEDKKGILDYRTKKSSTKYELLKMISEIFEKDIKIKKDPREIKDKRNLDADEWCLKSHNKQLSELKDYMGEKTNKYSPYLEN